MSTGEINDLYVFKEQIRDKNCSCSVYDLCSASVLQSNRITLCMVWVQERGAYTPLPVAICVISAGCRLTASELLGEKCQIIKLFNSSLSLYSWVVIKQHSINVRRERQWMTLSRWDGLNPCKVLGSTDWQLMFSPAATDEVTLRVQTFRQYSHQSVLRCRMKGHSCHASYWLSLITAIKSWFVFK